MALEWARKRVLITVRTYPVPAQKGVEVSCTAAVTPEAEWIRLFPVPYRRMPPDKRFKKYQWVDLDLQKARNDARPESYHLRIESITLGKIVEADDHEWAARRDILRPLIRPSLCAIQKERDENLQPTLGLFRPGAIKRLIISPTAADWSAGQQAILKQQSLFGDDNAPKEDLEKIPFDFRYEFTCDDPKCTGHKLSCTDWEMGQSYRAWREQYGDAWESKFRERYEREMIEKNDTHFYVGTVHQYPQSWIIVGLFYPPRREMADLFA